MSEQTPIALTDGQMEIVEALRKLPLHVPRVQITPAPETPAPETTERQVCPHCHLPAVMPEVCAPELNSVIESQVADRWTLFNAGYDAGARARAEELDALKAENTRLRTALEGLLNHYLRLATIAALEHP